LRRTAPSYRSFTSCTRTRGVIPCSGKIMRCVLAAILNNEDAGDISTLANVVSTFADIWVERTDAALDYRQIRLGSHAEHKTPAFGTSWRARSMMCRISSFK
jgi:hypothetical protein